MKLKLLVFTMLASTVLFAQDAFLSLNSGGHTARIMDIITTRDGKYFISASEDKTIRVWSAESMEEERKILGQIGPGYEGMVYAIALSPDEMFLAAGGFFKNNEIRIYDFASGRLLQLLESHENVISDLAFSPDGAVLVSASADQTVKVWRKQGNSYILKKTVREHNDCVEGVRIFESEGDLRIVSAGQDKRLVLYSLKQGLLRQYTHSGRLFYNAVSKHHIAAGGDGHMLKVFDLNLNPVQSIDNLTDPAGLSFSADGRYLLAGSDTSPYYCNIYDLENRFRRISRFRGHKNAVKTVAFLDTKRVISGGGHHSEICVWDPNSGREAARIRGRGRRIWSVGIKNHLIAFAETYSQDYGKSSFDKTFNMLKRTLDTGPVFDGAYRIRDRYGDYSLRVVTSGDGGTDDALAVMSGDQVVAAVIRDANSGYRHRCFGFGPGEMILSGGDLGVLEAYDISGRTIARFIGHTGEIWGVSANDRWMVSGGSDQIIRIWDLNQVSVTSTEIVTVHPALNLFTTAYKHFLDTDLGDYVIWTDEGFFDCSEGAAGLFGFHINRGPDKEAVFVSGENLFQQFYRPDLVEAKIQGGDISAASAKVNIQEVMKQGGVPPRVEWITKSGLADKRDVLVKGRIMDLGGGIGDVTLFLGNVPISVSPGGRGMKRTVDTEAVNGFTFEQLISLQNGNNRIGFTANNKSNTIESDKAIIELTMAGAEIKPRLYILALAVNQYRDIDLRLKYSVADAEGIVQQIRAASGELFGSVNVVCVYDEKVTKAGVAKAFWDIGKEMTRDDVFVLYIAGHGITHSADGSYYFLPVDFRYTSDRAIAEQGISMNEFKLYLAGVNALKSLILLDTCNSGSFAEAVSSRGMLEKTAIGRLVRATGRATIAASSRDQAALEGYEGHGVFTYTLLQALQGQSDYDKDNAISVNELSLYVENTLPKITFRKWGYEQIPQKSLQGMDFPIVIRR